MKPTKACPLQTTIKGTVLLSWRENKNSFLWKVTWLHLWFLFNIQCNQNFLLCKQSISRANTLIWIFCIFGVWVTISQPSIYKCDLRVRCKNILISISSIVGRAWKGGAGNKICTKSHDKKRSTVNKVKWVKEILLYSWNPTQNNLGFLKILIKSSRKKPTKLSFFELISLYTSYQPFHHQSMTGL